MHIEKETIIKRIDQLISQGNKAIEQTDVDEIYFGAISLVKMLYGDNSPQLTSLINVREYVHTSMKGYALTAVHKSIVGSTIGVLKSIKTELTLGLIDNIEKEITGELFGDFISMAKAVMSDNYKDAAAVLASAAIEDILKRYASMNNLDIEGKDMSEVISALKAKSLLQGPQASLVTSYVKLRNKAFHAEWDKIDKPEVQSLISFAEEFLIKYF